MLNVSNEEAIKNIESVGEECIFKSELEEIFLKKSKITFYDGFEPSGRMHIAQGLFKTVNVNKCINNEKGEFVFWIADWFALMNDKMGGDLEKIRTIGEYFINVWTAAGMNMSKVKFLWSSEEISRNAEQYWLQCLDISRSFNLTRIQKCCQIMGRKEGTLTCAQILYPLMQCTDIFFLKADVCQLGLDQRKVNMLAREYCDQTKRKFKPIILSHHMLVGLKEGQAKMSKSDTNSAIFMEDSKEDVVIKITNAFCPLIQPEDNSEFGPNPCLDYIKHLVFTRPNATFVVSCDDGSTKSFTEYSNLEELYLKGLFGEKSLKQSLSLAINDFLEPIRDHFRSNINAKELLEKVKEYQKEKIRLTFLCFDCF